MLLPHGFALSGARLLDLALDVVNLGELLQREPGDLAFVRRMQVEEFAPDTPVIMVFGASWSDEAVIRLTLRDLALDSDISTHTAPCIILIGAGLRHI